ncbi:MAG: hypothetical protein M1820_007146 [Bogoriella megaspora]|nr:MAG: hypothetical protein M1820_007146 [Bogoriella megaspora]
MFKRSFAASKDRAGKATKISKRSFRDDVAKQRLHEMASRSPQVIPASPILTSAIVTLVVGKDQRLFAAHEDVLCHSPFFAAACKGAFFESNAKRITLPDEQPEVLSAVLEYLYKGDYYPRLLHDKKRNAWTLEDADHPQNSGRGSVEPTVYHSGWGDTILRDTAIYCSAERYGLEELKRLSLRKQGLQSGIDVATILSSARFAYANTPDSDSRLRAHYLALIIRSRKTFKRSGTMQMEMEIGGKLFFDLFVAMCNHIDDVAEMTQVP